MRLRKSLSFIRLYILASIIVYGPPTRCAAYPKEVSLDIHEVQFTIPVCTTSFSFTNCDPQIQQLNVLNPLEVLRQSSCVIGFNFDSSMALRA